MLKENWRFVARVQRLGDFFITILAFFAAYYGRAALIYWDQAFEWGLPFEGAHLAPLKDYVLVLVIALISNTVILNWMGTYGSMRLRSSWELFGKFLLCAFFVFVALAAVLYLLKIDLSRSFISLFCLLMALGMLAERYLVLWVLRYLRRQGYNYRNVVLCGVGNQAIHLAQAIANKSELGVKIRAFADLGKPENLTEFKNKLREAGCTQIGKIIIGNKALQKALKEYAIDEVIFTDIVHVLPQVEDMVVICAEQGVRTTIAADLFSVGMVKSGMSYFAGVPLIHFQTPPGDKWQLTVKRVFDVVVVTFLLVTLAPLFLIATLFIKLTSPGPIFFIQKRMGLNGRIFDCYKFRSMYIGSEKKLAELKDKNEMKGPAFKLTDDPRITKVGRILRRYSLDELPQLWNVLKGDISLVGPRPPVPGEVSVYQRHYRRRLSMRPGITCTWQVSGRNNIKDFESWVKLDLEYIDNWSLQRDFTLLARTIPAVIFGTGAR